MPYNRPYRTTARGRRRKMAARTLQTAWRNRKRRQAGSLVARTALSNRRQIKKIRRNIETKMIELPTGTTANNYAGQNLVRIPVDVNGQDSVGNQVVLKPFSELAQGDSSSQRDGDWVTCKSLTYKIYFQAVTALLPETNHVGCIIVLDRTPNEDVLPNLVGIVPGTLDDGSLLGGNSQLPHLRYQNMATCGNTQRFKVLKHIKARVQTQTNGAVFAPDAVRTGTIKNPYKLKYDSTDAPLNQQILFFFYTDSSAVPHATVSCHCRFRFKDP